MQHFRVKLLGWPVADLIKLKNKDFPLIKQVQIPTAGGNGHRE